MCIRDRAETSGRPAVGLNIGGIANITVVTPDGPALAYDTGPGNALLDVAAGLVSGGALRQDTGGALARRGQVRTDLLDVLLADDYYPAPPPKSTGKEHFNAEYLRRALGRVPEVADADLLATLVELTARTIAAECRRHNAGLVVGSGGGMRNPALVAALAARLGATPLRTSDELGLPADAKEAYLTALLGFLTWAGVPANQPSATGAAGPRLLGSITPGARPLRPPEPTTSSVTRLRIVTPDSHTPTTPPATRDAAGGPSANR